MNKCTYIQITFYNELSTFSEVYSLLMYLHKNQTITFMRVGDKFDENNC